MTEENPLHQRLKELIIETLALEDITPAQLATDDPLFGDDGLALDSIDALEIAMVLEENYNVTLDDDPDQNATIFQSVRSIADFVLGNHET